MMRHWFAELSKKVRHEIMDIVVFHALAQQIRAMRGSRNWTQADLAKAMGVAQSMVARLETYRGVRHSSMTTLMKVASAFDVALQVRFLAWGEWIEIYISPTGYISQGLSPEALAVVGFDEDMKRTERTNQ